MKILAIETASNLCSVSVLENNKLIKEIISDETKNHSIMLMPLIDELLNSRNLKLSDIDLFACDKGPGSFTGIRIGISTIKGFCDVLNKPCIGVSSLDALARNVNENGYICSLIDAKHNNVYCSIYKFEDNKYIQIQDYIFDDINNILNLLNDFKNNIFFVGNCGILYKDMIKSFLNDKAIIMPDSEPTSSLIGLTAFEKYNLEEDFSSLHLNPLYLKKSNAELSLKIDL